MKRITMLNAILVIALMSASADAAKRHRKGTAKKKIQGTTLESVDIKGDRSPSSVGLASEIQMPSLQLGKSKAEAKNAQIEAAKLRNELIPNDTSKQGTAVGEKSDVKGGSNADHSGMATESIDKKGVLITNNNVDLMTDAKTKTSVYDGKVAPEVTKFFTEDGAPISISQAREGQRLIMVTPDGTRHPGVKTAAAETQQTLETSRNYSDPRYTATQLFPGTRVGQGAVSGFKPDFIVGLQSWNLTGSQMGYYNATNGMLALMRQIGPQAGPSVLLFRPTRMGDDLFGGGGGGGGNNKKEADKAGAKNQ